MSTKDPECLPGRSRPSFSCAPRRSQSRPAVTTDETDRLSRGAWKCPTCGFLCRVKSERHEHTASCSFASTSQNRLLCRHEGPKSFACDACPYRCQTREMLKVHVRGHAQVARYRCADCDANHLKRKRKPSETDASSSSSPPPPSLAAYHERGSKRKRTACDLGASPFVQSGADMTNSSLKEEIIEEDPVVHRDKETNLSMEEEAIRSTDADHRDNGMNPSLKEEPTDADHWDTEPSLMLKEEPMDLTVEDHRDNKTSLSLEEEEPMGLTDADHEAGLKEFLNLTTASLKTPANCDPFRPSHVTKKLTFTSTLTANVPPPAERKCLSYLHVALSPIRLHAGECVTLQISLDDELGKAGGGGGKIFDLRGFERRDGSVGESSRGGGGRRGGGGEN